RVGRRAVGRVDLDLADVVEERVETGAAEDADLRAIHRSIWHRRILARAAGLGWGRTHLQPGDRAMTEQPTEPAPDATTSGSTTPPEPDRPSTFEERSERFGKRAEEAANRWSKEPGVVYAADTAGRIWGLILLAVGLWFFSDVTLG